ncbi:MAG: YdiU family protein, partial [Gammaproteobacteria bacterium]|nr:YdiU family protein [Gammaproteobacteria bacterium]
ITTGSDTVWRETLEPAAMLLRVAASHIRFGSFEFFHYSGQHERVRELAQYCIANYYPECASSDGEPDYRLFLQAVVERTARLIAQWQCAGFAHGVLNTDNMSIVGETFDFGPYGFLDRYNEAYICNHSDHQGRYAFNAQPGIGLWNLSALAQALSSLLGEEQRQHALAAYEPALIRYYSATMLRKLGLVDQQNTDQALVQDLLDLMQANAVDFNLVFRELAEVSMQGNAACKVTDRFTRAQGFAQWLQRYRKRLCNNALDDEARRRLMQRTNPLYVPRNHLAQLAIERAENGDYGELEQLVGVLAAPFTEQRGQHNYAAEAPAWSESLQISCSS